MSLKHGCHQPAHPYPFTCQPMYVRPARLALPRVDLLSKSTANQAVQRLTSSGLFLLSFHDNPTAFNLFFFKPKK
jgi:hypothetical protein